MEIEKNDLEMIKILSIAINTLDVEEKNNYMKEQRKIIQERVQRREKIKELEDLKNQSSSTTINTNRTNVFIFK